ncbi:30S ribosome-binding factor RbfA [Vicingus serpentipes]|uniref:Ribosome-binding factor A n=1 Tax=Vicingus serpentipes TaxID=1926625 RepID=A0A5C6RSA0_9FLAO|nr:30S ribosome-binding factor RbfA [Vicingus serpentipes]TXB64835.1 30S ribosome-binding factor RbfA [Vicingus serpentipes]
MSSLRQNKVSRLLLKELSIIFQQNGTDWFPNTMISVTVVRVSPDLSFAKVYLSIFGATEPIDCVKGVNENSKMIRGLLGKIIKKQLRIVPEIAFYLDDSLDYAEALDEALKQ